MAERRDACHRLHLGIRLCAARLPAGRQLPDHVSARAGGDGVDGDLRRDGDGGVYRAGLAAQSRRFGRDGDGAGGRGLYLYRAGHRLGLGQTDVGHLVDLGCAAHLRAGAAVFIRGRDCAVARL